jgi:hypothetical protein
MNNAPSAFEICHDTYGPMLYGIAVEISPSGKEAWELFISPFKKIHDQKLSDPKYPSLCLTLNKLFIHTAKEQFHPGQLKNNFRLKQFENTPVLHKLLCEQVSAENYCEENKITRIQLAGKLRGEFVLLRNLKMTMEFTHPSEPLILIQFPY